MLIKIAEAIKQEQHHLDPIIQVIEKLIHKTTKSLKKLVASKVEARLQESTFKKMTPGIAVYN